METQGERRYLKCTNCNPYTQKQRIQALLDQYPNLEVIIMANIIRYDPSEDVFGDLLKGFFMRPVSFEGPSQFPVKLGNL